MKRLLILPAILFAFTVTTFGQGGDRKFKKFKGDLSFGFAGFPGNSDIKNGFLIGLEPKYAILDQLAIGVRIETVILAREQKDSYGVNNGEVDVKVYQSYLLTADFYFTNNYKVRPFAGAGGGIYSVGTANSYNESTTSTSRFGGMIRGGVELKHFRLGLEYNFVPSTKGPDRTYYDANYNTLIAHTVSKNSYFGIKAGFCFGGGPLNRD